MRFTYNNMLTNIISKIFAPKSQTDIADKQKLNYVKKSADDILDKTLFKIEQFKRDDQLCANITAALFSAYCFNSKLADNICEPITKQQYIHITEFTKDLINFVSQCKSIFDNNPGYAERIGYSRVVDAVKDHLNELRRMYGDLHL